MVDLETLSTDVNAAILSIGAVAFDPYQQDTFETLSDRFYVTCSVESNLAAKRHISGDTLTWWLGQNPDALRALFEEPVGLGKGLAEFLQWVENLSPRMVQLWANDPDFDVVILKQAFDACNVRWPWFFAIHRSCRTIKDLAWPEGDNPNFRHGSLHHKADDDAAAQALMVQAAHHLLTGVSIAAP